MNKQDRVKKYFTYNTEDFITDKDLPRGIIPELDLLHDILDKHDDQIDAYSFALETLLKKLSKWQRLLDWFKRRFK